MRARLYEPAVYEPLDDIESRLPHREHGLCSFEREAALEDRELCETLLFGRRQQVPAPVERTPEARMTAGPGGATRKQAKSVCQAGQQATRGQQTHSGSSEFDREWQTVEQADEFGKRRLVFSGQGCRAAGSAGAA